MKVTSSISSAGSLLAESGSLGSIKIPLVGVYVPLAVTLSVRTETDDPVEEAEVLAQGKAALAQVTQKLAQEVESALQAALKASVWSWGDGARDIYDTGELASSGNVTANADGISVSYSAPYASIVHNGGYIYPYGNKNARPIYLPGRPWVSSVLYGGGPVPQFDFDGFLQRELG